MGKRRNFTEAALQVMYENIDTNAGGFIDFFDDISNFFANKTAIEDDLSSINEWFGYILEAEDVTKQKLETILENVYEVETHYATKIETSSDKLKALQKDLNAFFDKIDETRPVMPKDATHLPGLTPPQAAALTMALIQMYGPGATIDTHLSTPEQIAQARIDAEEKGIHLPLTEEQRKISEEAYQRIKNARKNIHAEEGIGVGAYNQMDWESEFDKAFASTACYATCILLLAQFYGHNITMQDLIDSGKIRRSNGYIEWNASIPYFTRTEDCVGASEEVYCQTIYDDLLNGRPPIVYMANPSTHYVIAVGIREGAVAPYTTSDIIVMDPSDGTYKTLKSAFGRKKQSYQSLIRTSPC